MSFFADHQSGNVHVLPRLLETSIFPDDLQLEVCIDVKVTESRTERILATFSAAQQWPTPAKDLDLRNELAAAAASITVSVSASFLGAGRSAEKRTKEEHMEETRKIIEQLVKANSESLYCCRADGKKEMVWETAAGKDPFLFDAIKKLIPPNASKILQVVVNRYVEL